MKATSTPNSNQSQKKASTNKSQSENKITILKSELVSSLKKDTGAEESKSEKKKEQGKLNYFWI